MLYSGLGLFVAGSIAYLFVTNIAFLMVVRFIHGIGFGISTTVLTTVNLSTLPANKRGEGTGYFSLSTAAGTAIGPFFALFLTEHFGYKTMFVYCIVFSIFAFVSTAFATIKEIHLTIEQKEKITKSFVSKISMTKTPSLSLY